MVYKRAVKVSDYVYSKLQSLASKLGFESPNTLLEFLIEWWESLLVQSRVSVKDTWVYLEVSNGRVTFNIIQVDKMCKLRILPRHVCNDVKAKVPWL